MQQQRGDGVRHRRTDALQDLVPANLDTRDLQIAGELRDVARPNFHEQHPGRPAGR